MDKELKKTILYDKHLENKANMVEFGGFIMPLQYTSIIKEHLAVRNNVGLFDVSHMGEILISGKDTLPFINYLITNDIMVSKNNTMTYGLLLYPDGGVVDDLMVYKYSNERCLLVVNASNKDKDYSWIVEHIGSYLVNVNDKSNEYGQLALQGPKAIDILKDMQYDVDDLKLFEFKEINNLLISRSGYTGEDGFEIYGSPKDIINLFDIFTKKYQVTLCGLGCRDTLRFEAAMPLYGHEIDRNINPLEAGLKYGIKLYKDFIGHDALVTITDKGVTRKVVGLEMLEKGIARNGYEVYKDDIKIGYITTGYMIPNSTNCYAMALIDSKYAIIDDIVSVQIRKNRVSAKIRNKKFLNKKYVK